VHAPFRVDQTRCQLRYAPNPHAPSLLPIAIVVLAYNESVSVTILLFASIAQAAGRRAIVLDHAPADTVATVRERLFAAYPQLRPFATTLMYALDEEYVRENAAVPDGATLALIPPVSGG
jgi:molybdopterin synthase sulfur carrier subunit